jgi:alpha-mannosidase
MFATSSSRLCYVRRTLSMASFWRLPTVRSGMVYEDAEKLYAQVKKDGSELIEEAFKAIFGWSGSDARTQPVSGNFTGFNTTPFPRRDVVKVPFAGPHVAKLRTKLVQTTKDGKAGYALMDCSGSGHLSSSRGMFADCHPVSGKLVSAAGGMIAEICLLVFTNGSDHFVLKNDLVQLTISQGRITSLLDVQFG